MQKPGKHDELTIPGLLLSRMVIDHRVRANDPFRLTENTVQRAIADHLLRERSVGMAEVGELLLAA